MFRPFNTLCIRHCPPSATLKWPRSLLCSPPGWVWAESIQLHLHSDYYASDNKNGVSHTSTTTPNRICTSWLMSIHLNVSVKISRFPNGCRIAVSPKVSPKITSQVQYQCISLWPLLHPTTINRHSTNKEKRQRREGLPCPHHEREKRMGAWQMWRRGFLLPLIHPSASPLSLHPHGHPTEQLVLLDLDWLYEET